MVECGNCQHWDQPKSKGLVYGVCKVITESYLELGSAAFVTNEGSLLTRQEFSCNMGKEKE